VEKLVEFDQKFTRAKIIELLHSVLETVMAVNCTLYFQKLKYNPFMEKRHNPVQKPETYHTVDKRFFVIQVNNMSAASTQVDTLQSEGYEIESIKHHALEAITSPSKLAILSIGSNIDPLRLKYNLMRELSEMPIITMETIEPHSTHEHNMHQDEHIEEDDDNNDHIMQLISQNESDDDIDLEDDQYDEDNEDHFEGDEDDNFL
jgi:hypothetical protein